MTMVHRDGTPRPGRLIAGTHARVGVQARAAAPPPPASGRDRTVAAGRFRRDEGGQLLILTGVLLVLGFVVIGTTVVQLRALEESTSRLERDALLDAVDDLVANFNRTIVDSVELGETNLTDFELRSERGEARLRDTATQAGLYISVELDGDAHRDVFWRNSRCAAYDLTYWDMKKGIVIGYDRDTAKETIAGAVYDILITDGRQSIRMDYYVKIYECMVQNTPSHVDEFSVLPGTVENVTGAKSQNNQVKWVNETLTGMVLDERWVGPGTINITSLGWTQMEAIKLEDSQFAQKVVPAPVNWIDFDFPVPPGMSYTDTIPNFEIGIHAFHQFDGNDELWLRGYSKYDATQTILYEYQIPVTDTMTNFSYDPGPSPQGNAHWTRSDLEMMTWRLQVDEKGATGGDIGRQIRVDYVTANVTREHPEGYQVEATFDFGKIPPVFDEHVVEIRYQIIKGTTDENFLFQVYDSGDGQWETLDTWDNTQAGWQHPAPFTLDQTGTSDQTNNNQPRFRIIDPTDTDNAVPGDRDSIEIDWFEVRSVVSGT